MRMGFGLLQGDLCCEYFHPGSSRLANPAHSSQNLVRFDPVSVSSRWREGSSALLLFCHGPAGWDRSVQGVEHLQKAQELCGVFLWAVVL